MGRFVECSYIYKSLQENVLINDFPGNPARMTLMDSLLLIVDTGGEQLIHVCRPESKSYLGMAGHRGRGPRELLSVGNVYSSSDGNYFWCYDITSRVWMRCDYAALAEDLSFAPDRKIEFRKGAFVINEPQWVGDSLFVFSDLKKYKERFIMCRSTDMSDVQPVYNGNMKFKPEFPDAVLSDIFSTRMSVKPDRSKIALAGRYVDVIEIYDTLGNGLGLLKGPEKSLSVKFDKKRSAAENLFLKSPETKRAYLQIKSTDRYIYLLYSGKEKQDESNYSSGNLFYVLDWQGQPVARYDLENPVLDFAVDEKNGILYGIQDIPIPRIVSFSM